MRNDHPSIPSKTFSALTGLEIIDIYCKKLREAMEGSDDFAGHLTFPVVEGELVLTFRSYPGRNSVTPIVLNVDVKAQGEGELPELGEPITGTLKVELVTDTPDAERVKHGMPVTRPEMRNGRYVDVATVEKPLPEIPRMED